MCRRMGVSHAIERYHCWPVSIRSSGDRHRVIRHSSGEIFTLVARECVSTVNKVSWMAGRLDGAFYFW